MENLVNQIHWDYFFVIFFFSCLIYTAYVVWRENRNSNNFKNIQLRDLGTFKIPKWWIVKEKENNIFSITGSRRGIFINIYYNDTPQTNVIWDSDYEKKILEIQGIKVQILEGNCTLHNKMARKYKKFVNLQKNNKNIFIEHSSPILEGQIEGPYFDNFVEEFLNLIRRKDSNFFN